MKDRIFYFLSGWMLFLIGIAFIGLSASITIFHKDEETSLVTMLFGLCFIFLANYIYDKSEPKGKNDKNITT